MKQFYISLLFAFVIGCAPENGSTALMGATVLDGKGGAIENGVVVVADGRITCVGDQSTCSIPRGSTRHDMSGRFITPGLIDAHVHFMQTGWIDGRPDGIEATDVYPYDETIASLRADPGRWHRAYLCSGITAVYDVGGSDWTVTDPVTTDTDRSDRVHALAAGPLISYRSDLNRFYPREDYAEPVFLPFDSDDEVRANIEHLKNIGAKAVKVWFVPPPEERRAELETRLMLVGELARDAGLPLIVHATNLVDAKAALRAGAAMLVHSVFDQTVDAEFLTLLISNQTVYAPTMIVFDGWSRAMASVALKEPVQIDDPNNCVDEAILDRINHPERLAEALGDGMQPEDIAESRARGAQRSAIMAENLQAVRAAGGHIVVATDAGNPLTVHGPSIYWEMEAMQAAGMPPQEIIAAATAKGAAAMGMDSAIGTLEAGKIADIIIMAEDPREDVAHFRSLSHVMRKGVLREQAELQVR